MNQKIRTADEAFSDANERLLPFLQDENWEQFHIELDKIMEERLLEIDADFAKQLKMLTVNSDLWYS